MNGKRFVGLILVVALLFVNAAALAKTTDKYILSINSAPVNLRSGPSTDTRILTKLETGTKIKVIKDEGEWTKIEVNGIEGYVMTIFVTNTDPGGGKVTTDNIREGKTVYVVSPNSMPVNMRSGPGRDKPVVSKLVTATQVKVLETGDEWTKIRVLSTGDEGYIQTVYLTKSNPYSGNNSTGGIQIVYIGSDNGGDVNIRSEARSDSPVVVRVPTGSTATLINSGSIWTKVEVDGGTGFVRTEYVSNTPFPGDGEDDKTKTKFMFVKSPNSMPVNLRLGPNKSEKILAELVTGTSVQVLSSDGNWSQVTVGSKTGYIMNAYLVKDVPSILDAAKAYTAYVTTPNHGTVRVRVGAGTGYEVVTTLEEGTAVKVLTTVQGWARVRVGNVEGFINEKYLSKKKP